MGQRARAIIPSGCHTYSKGSDRFPQVAPDFIVKAGGCRCWDPDGNEFIDWGMGLRSVVLGHAYPAVTEAAVTALTHGTNYTRPSPIEVELAERIVDLIPCAEMVKFAKNGSDVTTAAVRLARAFTGRDLVIFPRQEPFLSVDDWFIGTTPCNAGIPDAVKNLSITFESGDLDSVETTLERNRGQVAAIVMEPAITEEPAAGYLEGVRRLADSHGVVLVFDEMITGFRYDLRGAQHRYGVTPDLATFGKALGNGFSVSALAGRRDVMLRGGSEHDLPRVFFLSTTHGAETHALAAALATIDEMERYNVVDHLWDVGGKLQRGLNRAAERSGLESRIACRGPACSPYLRFTGGDGTDDARLYTLFLQEMISRGILIPYLAPSRSHGPAELDRTISAAAETFAAIAEALETDSVSDRLTGPAIRPVFRRYNREDGHE